MKFVDILFFGAVGAWLYSKREGESAKDKKINGNDKPNPNFGCPPATTDIGLNTNNRQIAIDDFMYGPPNPALPSQKFWSRLAQVWRREPTQETIEEIKTMRCANCSFFDVSPQMQSCLPPNPDSYDKEGLSDKGVFGYCWPHAFKCRSDRTCKTWAGGGPIKANDVSTVWYKKTFSEK